MREFDLVSLRLFLAVCETRNIARAAEQQHIVASAASKRLMQLESTAGVTLLERHKRGVVPTAAGETLREHARAMLKHADQASRDMAAFGSGLRGKVRLLATVSSVAEYLPDDIAAFMQAPQHSDIQIDIEETLSRDIARHIHAGTATVGVCWNMADLAGLEVRPYRYDHLAIVAHGSHPLAQRSSCTFAETLDYDHVGLPDATAGHALLARAAAIAGREMHYRAQLSTFDAVLRVVRANLGITVAPVEIAAPYAEVLGLRVIPLDDTWALRRFAICHRADVDLPPAARLLVDFLVSRGNENAREEDG